MYDAKVVARNWDLLGQFQILEMWPNINQFSSVLWDLFNLVASVLNFNTNPQHLVVRHFHARSRAFAKHVAEVTRTSAGLSAKSKTG